MTRIFQVGQTLKVTYAPARDGSNTGRVVTFTFPDGRTVTMYHEDPNNPNDLFQVISLALYRDQFNKRKSLGIQDFSSEPTE